MSEARNFTFSRKQTCERRPTTSNNTHTNVHMYLESREPRTSSKQVCSRTGEVDIQKKETGQKKSKVMIIGYCLDLYDRRSIGWETPFSYVTDGFKTCIDPVSQGHFGRAPRSRVTHGPGIPSNQRRRSKVLTVKTESLSTDAIREREG